MFFLSAFCSALTCQNVKGAAIDTWAAFKIPMSIAGSGDSAGVSYFYRDDATPLARANGGVNSTTANPIYYSIRPLWDHNPAIGYAMFSDQPPDGGEASSTYAHLKAVIVFDKGYGLYLVRTFDKDL
jgi:hypothetical protein